MKNPIQFLIVLLSFQFQSPLFSQYTNLGISDNAAYLAFADKYSQINDTVLIRENGNYKKSQMQLYDIPIYIFQNATGKYIQTIHLKTKEIPTIGQTGFSANGKTFYAKDKKSFTLWNIPSGKTLKTIEADTIVLSYQYDSFYALRNDSIFKYSYYYGEVDKFGIKAKKKILKYAVTSDDKFLLALGSDNMIYIWRREADKYLLKTIKGSDFSTDKNGNFYTTTLKDVAFAIKMYNAQINEADFEKQKSITGENFIDQGKIFKGKILPGESFYSKSGDVYCLAWEKMNKKSLSFINLNKKKETFTLEQTKTKYQNLAPYFYSDTICFIRKDAKTIEIYNIYSGKLLSSIISEKEIDFSQILFDKNVLILAQSNNNLIVTDSKKQSKSFVDYQNLSSCKNDNFNFIVQNKENDIEYYPVKSFFDEKAPKYFEKIPINKVRKSKTDFKISNNDTVSYIKINKLLSIKNVKDAILSMQTKALDINDEYTGLQFYLSDKEFNYYFGASSKDWNNLFCKITVENDIGETITLDDYQIFETDQKNSDPLAICFVLDHSGSIYEEDAKTMQQSILTLVGSKTAKDAFSLVKFDDFAKREVGITTANSELRSKIKVEGLTGYGRSTALIDGIDEALEMLAENTKFAS